jgi:hypothetical protein
LIVSAIFAPGFLFCFEKAPRAESVGCISCRAIVTEQGNQAGAQLVECLRLGTNLQLNAERVLVEEYVTEYVPGEAAEVSGTFELLNFAGSPTGQTVAIEEGEALPPAPWDGRGASPRKAH